MGDLVFNGGRSLFQPEYSILISVAILFRKIWYLGWKPTVCIFDCSQTFHHSSSIGLQYEILPSTMLKQASIVRGIGVG